MQTVPVWCGRQNSGENQLTGLQDKAGFPSFEGVVQEGTEAGNSVYLWQRRQQKSGSGSSREACIFRKLPVTQLGAGRQRTEGAGAFPSSVPGVRGGEARALM